jgi:hypothetical protein
VFCGISNRVFAEKFERFLVAVTMVAGFETIDASSTAKRLSGRADLARLY